jgi:uncharacterized protein
VSTVELLCTQCGLCCDGVLFGDVELQPGDNPKRLGTFSLELFSKGRKRAFCQPCACFDGKLCTIYAHRPKRCRTFICRQLRLVQNGQLTASAAERNIRGAKLRADEVLRLVRALGNIDEAIPLNQRYAAIMVGPIDLAGDDETVELRSELMLAVGALVALLERDFLAAG